MSDMEYVLQLVNEARATAKMRPIKRLPRGKCADGDNCPLAKALPGNPLVQSEDVIWETFSGDSLPEKVGEAWATGHRWIDASGIARGGPDAQSACIVPLPGELRDFLSEFDEQRKHRDLLEQ